MGSARPSVEAYVAGIGCMVVSVTVGTTIAFFVAFTLTWSMVEMENYKRVPESQWWIVQAEIVAALILPVVLSIVLASFIARPGTRKVVAGIGAMLGAIPIGYSLAGLLGIRFF